MRFPRRLTAAAALAGAFMLVPTVHSDEGMWLFSNMPTKVLKERHGFEPTPKWLSHVQQSAVRFNSGGSGSFISADGLVLTNHHVALDALQKMSEKGKDYAKEGFLAKSRGDESKCLDLELNVLQTMENVTDKVNAAVTPELTGAQAVVARQKVLEEIQKKATDEAKNIRADVVTLYQGGEYHLYTFKRYTDVRLAFAPEQQMAFYGGDPDNFEYPRFDLDMCLFRVYENDKPAKVEHFLKWSANGAAENECVFVAGHPGRTNRANTMAELEYLRDTGYPFVLERLNRMEVNLKAWSDRTAENGRQAKEDLFGVQNSRKARIGGLGGLLDPVLMGKKQSAEQQLKAALAGDPGKYKDALEAFDKIAACEKKRAEIIRSYTMLEGGAGFISNLFTTARHLVRLGAELPKPGGERLREYGDSRLPSLKLSLFSEEPVNEEFEIVKLTDSLTHLCSQPSISKEMLAKVLEGKSPRARASELVRGCKLKDVATRKKLFDGGAAAVDASGDPMIALAKAIDADARTVRKTFESEIDEPKRQAHAAIAKARYAVQGASVYPDATFTLRLAFGLVKGYKQDGQKVPAFTDLGGLYERSKEHNNQAPFDLTQRWVDRKAKLDLKTPYNFVCTADIIGGNSGSPVINKNAEVVGLIFDGNIQSLVLDFIFDDDIARAVSVDSRAMIHAMRQVYDANELADEIVGKK